MIATAPCTGPVTFVAQTTDGSYQTVEIVALPDNAVFLFEVQALARRTDGIARAGYMRRAVVYREGGGAATIQGSVDTELTRESVTTWDVTIRVSGSNVLVVVRGAAGQTVNWQMSYTFEEVS